MPGLTRPVALTRAGMVAERVCRCFWPFWTVGALVLVPLLMGWPSRAPLELYWFALVFSIIALTATAAWGLRRMRWPSRDAALARVDASLPGRPIAALQDNQAIGRGDAASEAVWEAHRRRMAAAAATAKPVEPDLKLSARDPYGMRYISALLLVTALLFGSLFRLVEVGGPGGGGAATIASGPVWEGWIEPPAYTGRPSIYLADIPAGLLTAPAGSTVTLRLYGEVGALTVAETVSGRTSEIGAASDPQQSFTLTQDGKLAIEGPGGAAWNVRLVADQRPEIALTAPVEVEANGQMAQPYHAHDDYGIVAGGATVALDLAKVDRRFGLAAEPDPREALALDLALPITGARDDFDAAMIEDFSQNPFANLPVTLQLSVTDAAGQSGQSAPVAMTLPGRRFFQPIARAVIEQRRDLLWSRANAPRVLNMLRAVGYAPEGFFPNEITYLRLSFTLRRLAGFVEDGITVAQQDEIAQALWDLAVQLEDGTLADARARLERARDRLAEAMRNGASTEEIAELMDELRSATDDYMQMLAQNATPEENTTDQPQSAQNQNMEITQDEIQALMDQIQELMEQGRMAEAADLMDQLNQLMDNLQMTQREGGEGGPGQQALNGLSDTLRDQQGLSDEAFRDLQQQFDPESGQQPGQQGQDGQQPGQDPGQQGTGQSPGDTGAGDGLQNDQGGGGEGDSNGPDMGESLAGRQQALRNELSRQRGNLPALTGDAAEAARQALERAEEAMDGAEDALREDDLAEAIDRQAEAMNALRDGMRELGEALADNRTPEEGEGQQLGQAQGRPVPGRRDPLGRELGSTGQLGTDENLLGEDPSHRAEDLLDEIRRRAAERERPKLELDYLRRLLDRF